nr:MAG TPA: hypothetical protein [Caudoviricetes sp.]
MKKYELCSYACVLSRPLFFKLINNVLIFL